MAIMIPRIQMNENQFVREVLNAREYQEIFKG